MNWLPSMDLNHDKQIQSLLCYRYTTRQARRTAKLGYPMNKSSIHRLAQYPHGVGRGSDEPVKPHDVNGSRGRSPHRAGQIRTLPRLARVWPLAAALLALGSGCVKLNPSSEFKVPATTALAAARPAARPAANGPVAAPVPAGTF